MLNRKTLLRYTLSVFISSAYATDQDPNNSKFCINIRKTCEAAGFVVGEYFKDNGVWANCFRPLKNGKKVRDIEMTDALQTEIILCDDSIK